MDYALRQTEEDKKLSKPKRSKFPRFQQARHTVSTQEEQLKLRKWNSPMDLQPMSYYSQKKRHQVNKKDLQANVLMPKTSKILNLNGSLKLPMIFVTKQ